MDSVSTWMKLKRWLVTTPWDVEIEDPWSPATKNWSKNSKQSSKGQRMSINVSMEKIKKIQNVDHFRQTYLQVVETGHMKIWKWCSHTFRIVFFWDHTHPYLRWPSGKSSLNRMSWHLIWAGFFFKFKSAGWLHTSVETCFPDDLKDILHSLLVKYSISLIIMALKEPPSPRWNCHRFPYLPTNMWSRWVKKFIAMVRIHGSSMRQSYWALHNLPTSTQ